MLSDLHIQANQVCMFILSASQDTCLQGGATVVQKVLRSGRSALPDLYTDDACRKGEVMPGLFLG